MVLTLLSSKRSFAPTFAERPLSVQDGQLFYTIVSNVVTKFVKIDGVYEELAAS